MTTHTLRERVYAAIPEHANSQTIITNAPALTPPPLPAVDEARRDLEAQVRRHVLDGTSIPIELADAVLEADRDRERLTVLHQAVEAVTHVAEENIRSVREYQFPEPIAVLADELREIVKATRDLKSDLHGVTSAAEAIAKPDTATAWRELQALADRYDEVRRLQQHLTPSTVLNYGAKLYSTGQFRDALTVSTYFILRAENTPVTHTANGIERRLAGPRVDGDESWWPTDIDRAGALLRIVEADPWVPTADVMEHAFDLASSATANLASYGDQAVEVAAARDAAYWEYVEAQP